LQAILARINALAKAAKERPLTAEETQERDALRAQYLAAFRAGVQQQLDSTVVQTPDGARRPLAEHNAAARSKEQP